MKKLFKHLPEILGVCLIIAASLNFLSNTPILAQRSATESAAVEDNKTKEWTGTGGSVVQSASVSTDKSASENTNPNDKSLGTSVGTPLHSQSDLTPHTHTWQLSQNYTWVDYGNGKGRLETVEVEKCECGEVRETE